MPPLRDLSGQKFGKLTVIKRHGSQNGHVTWDCVCDCGNTKIAQGVNLVSGITTSCGCLTSERIRAARTKHGMANTRLYRIWQDMRRRCHNPNRRHYDDYGGRGICVCEEWDNSFEEFARWAIEAGYNDSLTIDRIDNDGNYCPDNCRWVNWTTQANNKRGNHWLEYNGERRTLREWADITGIPYSTVRSRTNALHWTPEQTLSIQSGMNGWRIQNKNSKTTPVRCIDTGDVFASKKEAAEWCGLKRASGISACCQGRRKTAGGHQWEDLSA